MQRLGVVSGGQHDVTQTLIVGDELMPVRADHSTMLQCRAVENLQAVARRVLEPDHLVNPAVCQLGLGGLFVRHTLNV